MDYIPQEDIELSKMLRALAHPARLIIVKKLAQNKACMQGNTVEVPGLTNLTVIQHLRALKKANVIQGRIFGHQSKYCLNPNFLELLDTAYAGFSANLREAKDSNQSC